MTDVGQATRQKWSEWKDGERHRSLIGLCSLEVLREGGGGGGCIIMDSYE